MATHTKTKTRRTAASATHRHTQHGPATTARHGIYANRFSDDEITRILESAYGGELSLLDEIGLARVALDRCMAAMNECSPEDLRQFCKLMLDGTGRVATLLRQQRILTGVNSDSLADNLAATLEAVRESLTSDAIA